jgi:MATE family multidrug resistance protein
MDMKTSASTKNGKLEEPLVGTNPLPENFDREESSIMISIAWPMLVSFFCRMAMASVDSAFVGHLSTKTGPDDTDPSHHDAGTFLAAAGLSDMVVNILVIPPLAFNQSLNALVSQAIGSGQKKMAGTWLQLSLFWLTVGYIPCLFAFFYVEEVLTFLRFTPEICRLGGAYAKWNALWPIPNGWYQCMRFYFQAQGNTRPAMYNNMFFLGMNVVLNWIFVFGGPFRAWCGWEGFGFTGAAMSISCSRSLQPLAYWLYMFVYQKAHEETWPGWSWDFLSRKRNMAFMAQSLPQVGTLILQACMNQSTTLMISSLGPLAIASSSATQAITQIFTGGLTTSCTAITGIRVGFHLGKDNWHGARRASILVFRFAALVVLCIAAVLIPLRHQAAAVITNDPQVQNLTAQLLIPVLLQTFAAMLVQCNVGGVFTSQGRTKLSTILSMGVELPMTLGIVAYLVFVVKTTVVPLYWGQAAVFWLEMAICLAIWAGSDWPRYAREAQERQEVNRASPLRSPAAAFASPLVQAEGMPSPAEVTMAIVDDDGKEV